MILKNIQDLLKPIIEDMGYELWGCDYFPKGNKSLLRIYIDKDTGISINDCEIVSKRVSAVLDVEDPIKGNYNLEISSPGIPRPLYTTEQYTRYINKEIQVRLYKPINNNKNIKGKLTAVTNDHIVINVLDDTLNIPFLQIMKASLISE